MDDGWLYPVLLRENKREEHLCDIAVLGRLLAEMR